MEESQLVERVAEAIYNQAVKHAFVEIEAVPFDVLELPSVFKSLKKESDTGQVLIFGSYLEDRMLSLLKTRMVHLGTKSAEEELFGSNGPLSTFSSRITLCYQLGWLSGDTASRLRTFKGIRNDFAHRAFRMKLSDPSARGKFAHIGGKVDDYISVAREALREDDGASALMESDQIDPALHNLCALAVLADDTFRDLIVRPIALSHNVDPRAFERGFDDSPKLLVTLTRQLSAALLELLVSPKPAHGELLQGDI